MELTLEMMCEWMAELANVETSKWRWQSANKHTGRAAILLVCRIVPLSAQKFGQISNEYTIGVQNDIKMLGCFNHV